MWGVGSLVRSRIKSAYELPRAKQKLWFYHCDFEMSGLATTSTFPAFSVQVRSDGFADFGVLSAVSTCFRLAIRGDLCSENIEHLLLYSTRRVQFFIGLDTGTLKLLATRPPTSKVLSVFEPWRNTCLENKCRLLLFFGKGGFPSGSPQSPDIEQCSCSEDVYDEAKISRHFPLLPDLEWSNLWICSVWSASCSYFRL